MKKNENTTTAVEPAADCLPDSQWAETPLEVKIVREMEEYKARCCNLELESRDLRERLERKNALMNDEERKVRRNLSYIEDTLEDARDGYIAALELYVDAEPEVITVPNQPLRQSVQAIKILRDQVLELRELLEGLMDRRDEVKNVGEN